MNKKPEPQKYIDARIKDVSGKSHDIRIEVWPQSILIRPEGYGEKTVVDGQGSPIMIENYDGRLRVIIWGDINREDPTHIINMEGAREDKRKVE